MSFFRKGKLQYFFWFLLAIVWLLLPFLILVNLTFFAEAEKLIIFLVLLITANDSAAYLVGKKWGKKKLVPTISPNKTYLGSFAGLLGTGLIAIIFNSIWQLFEFSQVLIFAFVLAIAAQVGDILESKFKRILNIKDTGSILLAQMSQRVVMVACWTERMRCCCAFLSIIIYSTFLVTVRQSLRP